jgi:predicted metal-dependent phosphoesterase TrpH
MFTDITGKRRLKACLHLHTTLSDGNATPEEVMAMYEKAGYDLLAITDHYKYHPGGQFGAMKLISGGEYHVVGPNTPVGIYETIHVLALDMARDPEMSKAMIDGPAPVHRRTREVVEMIHAAGGVAILAHPAWSLNTPEEIMDCGPFDGTEVYNSVSSWTRADRAYSGQFVDLMAMRGHCLPLLATDDAHYYAGEHMRGMTMLEADAVEELGVGGAIRSGRFYATQGPEIHLERISDTHVKVRCTPVSKIVFFSNIPSAPGRVQWGDGLTEAVCPLVMNGRESYIRAEVTDKNGLQAWSNILVL